MRSLGGRPALLNSEAGQKISCKKNQAGKHKLKDGSKASKKKRGREAETSCASRGVCWVNRTENKITTREREGKSPQQRFCPGVVAHARPAVLEECLG